MIRRIKRIEGFFYIVLIKRIKEIKKIMVQTKSVSMKILGYSERGIINSLIFSIGEDKEFEGNSLMRRFISEITLPEKLEIGSPINYTILLEQSFSRFGDADLVIIIHYKKTEDDKVLFIEGKVKTSQRKHWSLKGEFERYFEKDQYEKKEKYNGYSSNLFFQLYLKKLMFDNCTLPIFKSGVTEPKFGDNRKIGDNKVVLEALEKIKKCKEAYYIGIIPSTNDEIEDLISDNDYKIEKLKLYFLSWKTVHEFCKSEEKLKKVLDVFEYNKEQIYKED
jgi:hypothetical protein